MLLVAFFSAALEGGRRFYGEGFGALVGVVVEKRGGGD